MSGKRHKALARLNGRNTYVGLFDSYELALAAIRARRSGTREGARDTSPERTDEPLGTQSSAPTLRQWARTFLARRKEEGRRNHPEERHIWRKQVALAPFYDVPIDRITTRDVRSWIRSIASRPTRKTKRPPKRQTLLNLLNALRVSLSYAVEDDLIGTNPARGIKVARTDESEEPWTWLTLDEIRLIEECEQIPAADKAAMLFAIYSGLRAGEVFGLRWSDVDLRARTITVCRSWTTTTTKSKKVRRIPLFAPARDVLVEHRLQSRSTHLVFPGRGGRVHKKGYSANWRRNLALAGIKRRVRLHDARHTFATHLVSGSWGRAWRLEEIQLLLGHSTIHMVQRYAHMVGGGVFQAAMETFLPDAAE